MKNLSSNVLNPADQKFSCERFIIDWNVANVERQCVKILELYFNLIE